MPGELLYGVNEWLLFVLAAALLYGAAEVGFRYGRRSSGRMHPEAHSHVATVEGALLGLLALLLGFAFAMAMSRFDARKQVVLDEVNDLQTTYLRAHLLPDGHRTRCVRLLEEYAHARIEHLQAGADWARARAAEDSTRRLQILLWAEAVAVTREESDEVRIGYFIESLNRLLEDHTRRSVAMENHVPEVILHILLFVGVLAVAVTGYSSGLRHQRLVVLRIILVVLIAATLLVIIDLDRPRRGLIRVGEEGMVRLQRHLADFRLGLSGK